jgi:hypothetical protein
LKPKGHKTEFEYFPFQQKEVMLNLYSKYLKKRSSYINGRRNYLLELLMDKETKTVRDIFYSFFIEVRPDGFMRYRSANYLNEPGKKNELTFEFVGNIVGEQWREYKQVWITFVN